MVAEYGLRMTEMERELLSVLAFHYWIGVNKTEQIQEK
jgi:hypothetical protein